MLMYPDSSEFQWAHQRPHPGQRVRSRRGDIWVVDDVLQSGDHTYTVSCAAPGTRDLIADLLTRARYSMTPRELRRKKYLY